MSSNEIIFGGSFDPLHLGHLALANYALWAVNASKVVFVPSGRPPLKGLSSLTAAERLSMVKMVVDTLPWATLSTYEVDQAISHSKPSYSINTVRHLKETGVVGSKPYFLLGDDWAISFHQWHQSKLLAEEVTILLAVRQGFVADSRPLLDVPYQRLDNPLFQLSSTAIRKAIGEGQPYQFYLDHQVYHYIKDKGLYR